MHPFGTRVLQIYPVFGQEKAEKLGENFKCQKLVYILYIPALFLILGLVKNNFSTIDFFENLNFLPQRHLVPFFHKPRAAGQEFMKVIFH